MPYIKQEDREKLDHYIDMAVNALRKESPDLINRSGLVNYVISRIVASSMKPEFGWKYSGLSRAVGILEDATHEFRRRLMDKYEDECIERNGDLEEYCVWREE